MKMFVKKYFGNAEHVSHPIAITHTAQQGSSSLKSFDLCVRGLSDFSRNNVFSLIWWISRDFYKKYFGFMQIMDDVEILKGILV